MEVRSWTLSYPVHAVGCSSKDGSIFFLKWKILMFFLGTPKFLVLLQPVKLYLCFQSHNAECPMSDHYAGWLHVYRPKSVCMYVNSMLEWLFYKHSIEWIVAGSIDNSLDMLRVCGCPITRLTNLSVDPPSFTKYGIVLEGNLKTHGQSWCILDKSNAVWVKATYSDHFYDGVESVGVWCNDEESSRFFSKKRLLLDL